MQVRVRFFAGTRDAVGTSHLDVEVPDSALVRDLLAQLERAHPKLAAYRGHALLALDGAFVLASAPLRAGDTIAIMPPVSGGSGGRLVRGELPPTLALHAPGAGAHVTFTGVARGPAAELRFEAFEEMAETELASILDEARAKFSLLAVDARHRVDTVPEGAPIVIVATAARHRREAFEAAMWIMDELKTRVPIWKQEEGKWVNDVER